VRASRPASSQHRSSRKEGWGGKRHIPAESLAVGLDRHHPMRTARTSTWSPATPTPSGVRRRERKRVVVSDGRTEVHSPAPQPAVTAVPRADYPPGGLPQSGPRLNHHSHSTAPPGHDPARHFYASNHQAGPKGVLSGPGPGGATGGNGASGWRRPHWGLGLGG
jgi:hypothetical protein